MYYYDLLSMYRTYDFFLTFYSSNILKKSVIMFIKIYINYHVVTVIQVLF